MLIKPVTLGGTLGGPWGGVGGGRGDLTPVPIVLSWPLLAGIGRVQVEVGHRKRVRKGE